MSAVTEQTPEMRQRAEWMVPSDDVILELLRDRGNLTPAAVEGFGGPVADYVSERSKRLAEYGLTQQIHWGLYAITDKGEAYLDEELDARTLEASDVVPVTERSSE